MKSGFVAVVGRPNVGKSTLVNALVGSKVSITSTRPQTTRSVIRGVVTDPSVEPAHQIVLVDTPGIHKPRTTLGGRLNGLVYGALSEADGVLFVVDATAPIGTGDQRIAERLGHGSDRVVVAVNKVDAVSGDVVGGQLAEAGAWDFGAYVPVSATGRTNLEPLVRELVERLPEGPMFFPADATSDQAEAVLIAEIIREKFLDRLRDELPHSLAIVIDEIDEDDNGTIHITAKAVVERRSQKGIVIGAGGSMLEVCGSEARAELEALLDSKVHLAMRVVVEKDWQERPDLLDRLGFADT